MSASYGFGSFVTILFSAIEDDIRNNNYDPNFSVTTSSVGPLSLKYENAITNNIGLGFSFNYLQNGMKFRQADYSTSTPVISNYDLTRSTISFLVRMNVHFIEHEKVDPYFGLGLGYRSAWWDTKVTSSDPTYVAKDYTDGGISFPIGFESVFGARYYLSPGFGLFTEVGIAKAVLQFGITGKF